MVIFLNDIKTTVQAYENEVVKLKAILTEYIRSNNRMIYVKSNLEMYRIIVSSKFNEII